jgi:hypothetical protein
MQWTEPAAVQAGNVTLGDAGNVRLVEIHMDSTVELGWVRDEWFEEEV